MTDRVVVVIIGFRCPDEIRDCLSHLSRSHHSEFEVRICENGGLDAFRALVEAIGPGLTQTGPAPGANTADVIESWTGRLHPGGQMVSVHAARANFGYAGGVNLCLDQIAADPTWTAVWILNPDTEPEPAALSALLEHLHSNSRYGVIGSRVTYKESGRVQFYGGGRWRRWMARGYNIGRDRAPDAGADIAAVEQEMTYVMGVSMLVSRAYIKEVGSMDESYFLYNEEVDWCFRRGRFTLGYAHGSIIRHAHGATMGSHADRRRRSALSVYLHERNKLLFTRRFYPGLYPFAVVSTLVLLTAEYLSSGAAANFRIALSGWFAGLRGETGPPDWHSAAGTRTQIHR